MNQTYFPGCCAARILKDFGGHECCERDTMLNRSVDEIKEWLRGKINSRRSYDYDPVFVVITNNGQTAANEALHECGFKHSPWMSKIQHPVTKIRIWWYPPKNER